MEERKMRAYTIVVSLKKDPTQVHTFFDANVRNGMTCDNLKRIYSKCYPKFDIQSVTIRDVKEDVIRNHTIESLFLPDSQIHNMREKRYRVTISHARYPKIKESFVTKYYFSDFSAEDIKKIYSQAYRNLNFTKEIQIDLVQELPISVSDSDDEQEIDTIYRLKKRVKSHIGWRGWICNHLIKRTPV